MTMIITASCPVLLGAFLWLSVVSGSNPPPPTSCTLPIFSCFVDPCMFASCPAHPLATCRSNYCGGCNADFFDVNGMDVTTLCNSATPTPYALSCPPPIGGVCAQLCQGDEDCPPGRLCCVNGCGRACIEGITSGTPTQGATSPTHSLATPTTTPSCTLPCPLPLCVDGYILSTLPGQCCPTCLPAPTTVATPTTVGTPITPTIDCKLIQCDVPICRDSAPPIILPGQCCPSCPPPTTTTTPNCDLVRCLLPVCEDGATPTVPSGECCAQCSTPIPTTPTTPTTTTPPCGLACVPITCGQGTVYTIPDGQCCPTCIATTPPTSTPTPIDCARVRCAYPTCLDGATPFTPSGRCCPICPRSVCFSSIYPADFIPVCLVVVRRWTFDSDSRGCMEIRYSPCGQEEEQYNIFIDQLACETACGSSPPVTSAISPSTTPATIRPTPLHAIICPLLASCPQTDTCSSDTDCMEGELCCTSSCGQRCSLGDRVPYYPVPLECPTTQFSELVGTCDITQRSCTDNSACGANQLCCQNGGCGRYCSNAVSSAQPCFAVREMFTAAIPGAYVPTCQDDGRFAAVQFHGSTGYSWCVNVQTGYPISSFYPRGSHPQCAMCTVNGVSYAVGETFTSSDGCNTCVCGSGGRALCTRRACPSVCSLPPSPGPCRAAIPSFYYDQISRTCRQFTYGGCGGNANKFRSVQDCLTMCAPSDRCLQSEQVGLCDAAIPSFFFNGTSGMCERFNYGGCGGNDNNFATGPECLRACSPDTPPNRCWSVQCAYPSCLDGSQPISDDQHCCPYCRIPNPECRSDQMQCSDGQCISNRYVCDSLRDCPNGEDEFNCQESCDFTCGDGHCIARSQVCDSRLDCTDHSDAQNCSQGLTGVKYFHSSDIPQQCPNVSNLPAVCGDTCTECSAGQLCCNSTCGRLCVADIPIKPICRSIARQNQHFGLLGAFEASCEDDGSFSAVQCHEATCWCVDVETGQPVTNGSRGGMESCPRCSKPDGDSVPVGTSFSSEDGCNTCKCTQEYGIICTARPCVTKSCTLDDETIPHGLTYRDECSSCLCTSGSLKCNRTDCSTSDRDMELLTVNMTFSGDHNLLASEVELSREVKRSLLYFYDENFNLHQEQIRTIKLSRGSIVVTVILEPTNITGANLTLLLSQMKQDYTSGIFAIRFNGLVLEPTGVFQSSAQGSPTQAPPTRVPTTRAPPTPVPTTRAPPTPQSSQGRLTWWHYLLIGAAAMTLLLCCVIVVIILITMKMTKRNSDPYQGALMKDNDYVSFKKDQSELSFESPRTPA